MNNHGEDERTFTVTVDFTIDLDALEENALAELDKNAEEIKIQGEPLEKLQQQVYEDIQRFWNKTDMELVNIVMTDLHETLEEIGMDMRPVGFIRGGFQRG